MELAEAFYALQPTTRLRVREEVLAGTLEALISGRADLALGVVVEPGTTAGIQSHELGDLLSSTRWRRTIRWLRVPQPISDEVMMKHRAVAVSDSAQQRGTALTMGLLAGAGRVHGAEHARQARCAMRGLGGGFLPEPLARPYLESGRLVARECSGPRARSE
jgi:DNA-binding transcriptional LysR family regulator